MIDITDFKKYKIIYLIGILAAALLVAFKTAPSYHEVFVDVTVEPPENMRKTDFSWITVNEWFITQTRLITSDSLLKNVKSETDKAKLRKTVSANRLGVSNIIRISVFSQGDPSRSKVLASEIADLYLRRLNKPAAEAVKAVKSDRKKISDALREERRRILEEIGVINKRLMDYKIKYELLEKKPSRLREIKGRIGEIDAGTASLKLELASLRSIYADSWPSVSSVKSRIAALESEKRKLMSTLPEAQRLEDEKTDIVNKINQEREDAAVLQERLKTVAGRLEVAGQDEAVKEEAEPEKEAPSNRIISEPAQKAQGVSVNLGIRLFAAALIGVAFWFLAGALLKNAYMLWVWKSRFFKK